MALSEKRKGRITGSQVGAILGLCPWKSREEVMTDWLYGKEFEGNAATAHGTFYEKFAIEDLARKLDVDLKPSEDKFYISEDYPWLGATPDVIDYNFICEIKCPYSKRKIESVDEFKSILDADMEHYYAQIQVQLHCTNRELCYFYQWSPNGLSQLEKVNFDPEWFEAAIPKLLEFLEEYKERLGTLETDEMLAQKFYKLKLELDTAKEALEEHKKKLIDKCEGQKRKFGVLSVYPIERAGSISYAKVVKEHLPDVDLEPFRGSPSVSWGFK